MICISIVSNKCQTFQIIKKIKDNLLQHYETKVLLQIVLSKKTSTHLFFLELNKFYYWFVVIKMVRYCKGYVLFPDHKM